MSEDVTPDPFADPLRFGPRVQILRERRGMTQAQLADLVGISPHTLRKIENGQQKAPGLDMVMRIAEALRVRDLADLTGRPDDHVDLFVGPGHPRLGAVKAAVNSFPLTSTVEPPPIAHLEARLHAAWRERHASKNHREAIGRLLPDLIRDAQTLGGLGCGAPPGAGPARGDVQPQPVLHRLPAGQLSAVAGCRARDDRRAGE
jgi:transcriptional regulator with XRE-family HTH domain